MENGWSKGGHGLKAPREQKLGKKHFLLCFLSLIPVRIISPTASNLAILRESAPKAYIAAPRFKLCALRDLNPIGFPHQVRIAALQSCLQCTTVREPAPDFGRPRRFRAGRALQEVRISELCDKHQNAGLTQDKV